MATRKEAISDEQVQTIRAAVLRRRGGPLSIDALEMEGPRDDEVLVRITASGICHTDISYINEWYDASEGPLILGHEGAGIVERVGKKGERLPARRSRRPFLPVLRHLLGMPRRAPGRLPGALRAQLGISAPWRRQCLPPKRRERASSSVSPPLPPTRSPRCAIS